MVIGPDGASGSKREVTIFDRLGLQAHLLVEPSVELRGQRGVVAMLLI
jgi:hypothetical protein